MLQRLVDIKTDATAAFEKESRVLLVRLDDDLISLALADKEAGSWQAAEILKVEASDRIHEDFIGSLRQSSSLINYKGLPAKVLIATSEAMAVPASLAESIPLFFEAQFGSKHRQMALLTDVVDQNIIISFVPQLWQQELIKTLLPEAEILNTLALQTRQSLLHAKDEGTCLYVQVGKTCAEVVLIKQGKLTIAHSLTYKTPDDLLYHFLNIARQFGLQPGALSVQLQGLLTDDDPVYQLLRNYFAPVHFAESITPIQHKAFREVPPHFFTGLMYFI